MNPIRAFIAVEINEKNILQLSELISNLKSSGADVKWVGPNAMHFTLKFLGNIDTALVKKIGSALNNISKRIPAFSIHLSGISAFPNLNRPRVIWVGVDRGSDLLCYIQKELEESLEGLGFKKEERSFKSHLTLGRMRSFKNFENLKPLLKEIEFQGEVDSEINEIILFQSQLTPQGPIYTKLYEAKFNKTITQIKD